MDSIGRARRTLFYLQRSSAAEREANSVWRKNGSLKIDHAFLLHYAGNLIILALNAQIEAHRSAGVHIESKVSKKPRTIPKHPNAGSVEIQTGDSRAARLFRASQPLCQRARLGTLKALRMLR